MSRLFAFCSRIPHHSEEILKSLLKLLVDITDSHESISQQGMIYQLLYDDDDDDVNNSNNIMTIMIILIIIDFVLRGWHMTVKNG